jgi:formylglycine-generating enzyme required for sulfatase activity
MGHNPVKEDKEFLNGKELPDSPCSADGTGENLPVRCISWEQGVEFANALSKMAGLEEVYYQKDLSWKRREDANGYRLPLDAEWEYAARKTLPDWFTGSYTLNCKDFQTKGCGNNQPRAVNLQAGPNDLLGNAWELVWDRYGASPLCDLNCVPENDSIVRRGGNYLTSNPAALTRSKAEATDRVKTQGIRLAQNLE